MCDQPCHECRKCDEPEICEYCDRPSDGMVQAVCGHLICPGCVILCEGCDEAVCPGCVVKRHGNKYCGEVDCFPGSEEEDD